MKEKIIIERIPVFSFSDFEENNLIERLDKRFFGSFVKKIDAIREHKGNKEWYDYKYFLSHEDCGHLRIWFLKNEFIDLYLTIESY